MTALAVTLVASPFVSFAKENATREQSERSSSRMTDKGPKNEKSNKVERVEKQEKKTAASSRAENENENERGNSSRITKTDTSCLKAYGHLIAPGWFKKNGSITIDANCWLPFGIAKKFRGNNASSTPDVIAPVISNLSFNPAQKQAEIRWNTDENSNSVVFWNTTSTVDTSDTAANRITKADYTKNHRVILRNLTPETTYYVVVKSKDASGNSSLSNVGSFKTLTPTADTQVPVISNVVTIIGTSTIQVGWKTNENTTDRVYYSTILPVTLNASTTSYVSNTTGTQTHALTLSGLTPDTTYYVVIESTDTAGNVTTSATFSAHTGAVIVPVDTTAPVISNVLVAPGVSTTTVTWTTNELSTSKLFYSTVNPLDIGATTTATVLNGSLVTSHSISLSSLASSTVYYFKIQSSDSSGNVTTSDQFSATTTAGI